MGLIDEVIDEKRPWLHNKQKANLDPMAKIVKGIHKMATPQEQVPRSECAVHASCTLSHPW